MSQGPRRLIVKLKSRTVTFEKALEHTACISVPPQIARETRKLVTKEDDGGVEASRERNPCESKSKRLRMKPLS